jgi:hypothetical protein
MLIKFVFGIIESYYEIVLYQIMQNVFNYENSEDYGLNLQTRHYKERSDLLSRMRKSENHWISR